MFVNVIGRHAAPFHADDTIGVALILAANPAAKIVEVRPQDAAAIDQLRAEGAALVDVGGVYDPVQNQFDHHQSGVLSCAAVLVALELGLINFVDSPSAEFMSKKDLRGFAAAVAETGYRPSPAAGLAEANLTSATMTAELASAISAVMMSAPADIQYGDLMVSLWEAAPASAKAEAAAKAAAKAKAEAAAIASASVIEVEGIKVAYSATHALQPGLFGKLGVVASVSRNAMAEGHTSVMKDTSRPETARMDLGRAASAAGVSQVFLHNAGFIAVLDVPASAVNPAEVIAACLR